jgi:hypothetical protein
MNETVAALRERWIKFGIIKTVLVVATATLLFFTGLYINDQRPFSSGEWKALRAADHKGWRLESMAYSLVDQGTLIGKTERELEELLGKRDKWDRGYFAHGLEWCVYENWFRAKYKFLTFEFDSKGRVASARIRETGW